MESSTARATAAATPEAPLGKPASQAPSTALAPAANVVPASPSPTFSSNAVSSASALRTASQAARMALAARSVSSRSPGTGGGGGSSTTLASGLMSGADAAVATRQAPVAMAGALHVASINLRSLTSTGATDKDTPCMSKAVMRLPDKTRTTLNPRASTALMQAAPKTASSIGVVVPRSLTIRATSPFSILTVVRSASVAASCDAVGVAVRSKPGSPWIPRPSSTSPAPSLPDGGRPGSVQTS
mmetsp:Transcript_24958/g.64845  ORF Transcript_24958/g.64845 Transcript_24958/m.64845 type:complete len:243 (-) Transcript_24958:881-1609(-)